VNHRKVREELPQRAQRELATQTRNLATLPQFDPNLCQQLGCKWNFCWSLQPVCGGLCLYTDS
jgi:hypothetical protein